MSDATKNTIGQAIDQALSALSTLDKREQQIVIATVCSLLDVTLPSQKSATLPSHGSPQPPAIASQSTVAPATRPEKLADAHRKVMPEAPVEHGLDVRSLKNVKQPANAIQMACVAAFYLQEHAPEDERTKEIASADLERLFKQAGFKLPSRIQQVLPDAKSAGYFESVDRGKYKLSRVGYNLVTHSLPRVSAA